MRNTASPGSGSNESSTSTLWTPRATVRARRREPGGRSPTRGSLELDWSRGRCPTASTRQRAEPLRQRRSAVCPAFSEPSCEKQDIPSATIHSYAKEQVEAQAIPAPAAAQAEAQDLTSVGRVALLRAHGRWGGSDPGVLRRLAGGRPLAV